MPLARPAGCRGGSKEAWPRQRRHFRRWGNLRERCEVMEIMKNVVRYAVIAGLVGGAGVVIAGPDRAGALVDQCRGTINNAIDLAIDDPIALRAQMRALEAEYPERIAEVRGDLSELQQQTADLKRELEVSHRVVSLAGDDLNQMQGMIAKAEASQAVHGPDSIVRVVFSGEPVDLKDAYGKANRIQQVHTAYNGRATDIERDLGYLSQQETRLTELLSQLETEHTEYQAQIWSMDRQVDSIARNERLIEVMAKRQRTIDEQSRYGAHSLDQLAGKFADIRAKQEAKLEALGTATSTLNYEDRAKFEIDATRAFTPTSPISPSNFAPKARPKIIEITPYDLSAPTPVVTPEAEAGPMAAR